MIGDPAKCFPVSLVKVESCGLDELGIGKTRKACADVIKAIFLPPPLMAAIRRAKKLPIKDIIKRSRISNKLIDKHRKYLVTSALILDGDYPALSEYLGYMKQ